MEQVMVKNLSKVLEVGSFIIIFRGDPSVGIFDSQWELNGPFYFDNQDEVDAFKNKLNDLFEDYCGEHTNIISLEEHLERVAAEDRLWYEMHPVRYLIKDNDYSELYKMADSVASYSSNIGDAIHFELPKWIPEEGNSDTEVIKSTDPEFRKIMLESAAALESEINNLEYKLRIANRNLNLIMKELNFGK